MPDDCGRDYRKVLGSIDGLRRGITTGTCAQAAARAAALLLLEGRSRESVEITLPEGRHRLAGNRITVPVAWCRQEGEQAIAAVVKDGGDDTDVTSGAEIVARVHRTEKPGVEVEGGRGVGRVTHKGLPVPVGQAAINPVPRRMIERELATLPARPAREPVPAGVSQAARETQTAAGWHVVIEVPGGEALAAMTWNPRLGVVGGISIIGTTGIVEPKSSEAYRRSIDAALRVAVANGRPALAVASGYVSEGFLTRAGVPQTSIVTVGDHFGYVLDRCRERGVRRVALVGHLGKLVKVAAGLFDTHSRNGDARLETIAAWAAAEGASSCLVRRILELRLAEESVSLLREAALAEKTFTSIARRVVERAVRRVRMPEGPQLELAAVLLSLEGEPLAANPGTLIEERGWRGFLSSG